MTGSAHRDPRSRTRAAPDPEEVRQVHAQLVDRGNHLRLFGYDADAAVKFVLSKAPGLTGPVLDIGTGRGRFAVALARLCPEVTTVDIRSTEQRFARLEATHAGVDERIRFLTRSAARLPWRKPRFGAVVSLNAFHHMEDPDRVFSEMRRVLLPGGVLVLADFSVSGFQIMDRVHRAEGRVHPHPPSHFSQWRAALLRSQFRVKRFRGFHQDLLVALAPTERALSNRP